MILTAAMLMLGAAAQDAAPPNSSPAGQEQVEQWLGFLNAGDVPSASGALAANPSVSSDNEDHKVTIFTKDVFFKWLKFCEQRKYLSSYVMPSPPGDGYTMAFHLICPQPGTGWDKSTATLVPVSFFLSAEDKGVRVWTSKNDQGEMR